MTTQTVSDPFRGIVYFTTAARAQSFTAAAEQLGISKSALGKSIAKLESQLNTSLFHRTTRKLSLTTAGEAYLASCQLAIDTLQAAELLLQSKLSQPSGRVRIDMPAAFGRSVMMPVLLGMAQRYPQLQLTLTFNDKVIDPMDAGFDLAIRFGPLKDSTDLVAKALTPQTLVLAASPLYLHTFGTPKALEDLSTHQCIVAWRGGSSLSWRLKNAAGQEHRFQPKAFHQISDGDAMVAACVAGAGIIQFPQSLLRPYLDNGTLLQILPELTPSPTELNIIWPRTKQLMPAVRFIVDELVQLSDAGTFS
ncbi:LysR family transcriptional regulator [uncultured Rheinheimera sp.]|uniref:LysR family transcriptional regulator n=1 Tax=uncultured Rheinheimera sp. TaxID=400532 RepID=UPI0025964A45|nr:LysR family transcriptional regulator [uncultured Rheinheimera sp.]